MKNEAELRLELSLDVKWTHDFAREFLECWELAGSDQAKENLEKAMSFMTPRFRATVADRLEMETAKRDEQIANGLTELFSAFEYQLVDGPNEVEREVRVLFMGTVVQVPGDGNAHLQSWDLRDRDSTVFSPAPRLIGPVFRHLYAELVLHRVPEITHRGFVVEHADIKSFKTKQEILDYYHRREESGRPRFAIVSQQRSESAA